jgi:hypothetical protein
MKTTVHSLRCEAMRPGDVRVDRASEWGNPFIIGRDGTREQVVARYADWIAQRAAGDDALRDRLAALAGKRLFCWCAPLLCHGHILATNAEALAKARRAG